MIFKNLAFYRLPVEWNRSAAELEERLARRPLLPCGPFDMTTRGWVPVMKGGRLLHSVNRHQTFSLGVNQKLLPGSIVRQAAEERAALLAQEQGFAVGRKQMRELRNRVADELRARAFTRLAVTRAWIDADAGWFVIDAAGTPRAEALIETLSDTLGGFAPRALETTRSPHAQMAAWLMHGDTPGPFSIDEELELQSADKSKSVIRYTRHPLDGKEIRAHLAGSKYPTRLGLTWRDRVSFVLTDKLSIKRVEFAEIAKESSDTDEADPAEQFDIDFAVMAGELSNLLKDLAAMLGTDVSSEAWPAASKVA